MLVGELRRQLSAEGKPWTVSEHLDDDQEVPTFALGVPSAERLVPAGDVPPVDFPALLGGRPPANPFLTRRRVGLGFLASDGLGVAAPRAPQARSAAVDWRQRWNWRWITTIRDQGPCGACWAFADTALVEAMVRIEHSVWTTRSEGDVHDGMGHRCDDADWPEVALEWIRRHGIADPGVWPYHTDDAAYRPAADRTGRTVNLSAAATPLGETEDQKTWLDTVGPVVAVLEVWDDFYGLGSGVYHKLKTATYSGLHAVLVVGYDDAARCWIVKNSWGTWWGDHGFGRIGYGQVAIDDYAKFGQRGTDPDPWTKRRLHSGTLYESGSGSAHRNFELLAPAGADLRLWSRQGSAPLAWSEVGTAGVDDAAGPPTAIESTFGRHLEACYATTSGRLRLVLNSNPAGEPKWAVGEPFGPADAGGVPAFIQSSYGHPGHFEVVVRTADGRLNHWWRASAPPWTWTDAGRFGEQVAHSGATVVQARSGNLELVAVRDDGSMQLWWRDDQHGFVWKPGEVFGAGAAGPPCMIEGQYGATDELTAGNYELCAPVGGQVEHWWRDNRGASGWHRTGAFGHDVQAVLGLVEGSFGFHLEVVVLRTDGQLQHWWRDLHDWHEGPVIGSTAPPGP
jgi:Papain family cysteine protease